MPTWRLSTQAPRGRTRCLRLSGSVDETASVELRRALTEAGRPRDPLLLDVSSLQRLSPVGLRALAVEEHRRRQAGGAVLLTDVRPAVQRELAGAGLLHLADPVTPQRRSA